MGDLVPNGNSHRHPTAFMAIKAQHPLTNKTAHETKASY